MRVMFIKVKFTNTPVNLTKKSSNTEGVSTSSLHIALTQPITYVILVYKRMNGWKK
jgi:hypothetical protein